MGKTKKGLKGFLFLAIIHYGESQDLTYLLIFLFWPLFNKLRKTKYNKRTIYWNCKKKKNEKKKK